LGSLPPAWLVFRSDQRLALLDGIILSQRMTLEAVVHQDALQVRVPAETDPEHIPDLALEPVGAGPQRAEGVYNRVTFLDGDHKAQPVLVGYGVKVVHDREARVVRRSRPGILIRNLTGWPHRY